MSFLSHPTFFDEVCPSVFSRRYWHDAAKCFSLRTLCFAALIVALRVAVKSLRIPIAAGLNLSFDCYVNALGSMIYGPLVSLLVGAVSDTLGCLFFPSGAYFFPFIFVEMSSSFLFALFLWRRRLSTSRVLLARFTVVMVCNVVLTSAVMKWDYYVFYGIEKANAYNLINLVRIGKNLVLFPAESVLLVLFLGAMLRALKALHILPADGSDLKFKAKHVVLLIACTLLSIGLILGYVFYFKDFISAHNIKLF